MKSILITGCNRGLGLGLIKYLVQNKMHLNHIFATCRNINAATELRRIASTNSNIHIIEADLSSKDGVNEVAKSVSVALNSEGLDVLINNAGISSKFTRLNLLKYEELMSHFQINTIAPIMLTKALIPELKQGKNKNNTAGIVVNMSSILGSISENDTGGFYPYRTSKSALNAATKSMCCDLKNGNIPVVSLHPGWVKTDMGGKNAPLEIDEAINKTVGFISNISMEQSGQFFDTDGKNLPW